MSLKRFLFLHERNVLGWGDGQDAFHLHHEFWDQVCVIVLAAAALEIGDVVSDSESAAVSDLIERKMSDDSWLIHLALWGDRNGEVVRELIGFLRGGSFVVVELEI